MTDPTKSSPASLNRNIRLDKFSSEGFDRGASRLKEVFWVAFGQPLLRSSVPGSRWRVGLLRIFQARIGEGTVWKPGVRVKFPWRLIVGDHSWIGEDVWIDNLAQVEIADHVCISQGAYLCTGNHDWSRETFDLITTPIFISRGAWVGAKALLAPGACIQEGCVVAAGSVASGTLQPFAVYRGNPAIRAGAVNRVSIK